MSVSIVDIAKMANVSTTTVSRVLNNKPDVKEETRQKIMALVKEYDYQPNMFAKAIISKESKTIALLVVHSEEYVLLNPTYYDFLLGVQTVVRKKGYYLLPIYECTPQKAVNLYKQHRVDGFIVMTPVLGERKLITALHEVEAPVVTASPVLDEHGVMSKYVECNMEQADKLAMKHIMDMGHTQIALLAYEFDQTKKNHEISPAQQRVQIYRECLQEKGIKVNEKLIYTADRVDYDAGSEGMEALLQTGETFTAVLCLVDVFAMGALQVLHQHGIKVPEEISVVGFEGSEITKHTYPILATTDQKFRLRGEESAKYLMQILNNKTVRKPSKIKCEFVMGESLAKVRKK